MIVFCLADDAKVVWAYPQDPEKLLRIGAGMCPDMEMALIEFLCNNANVFMWKPSDILNIPHEITEHCFNIKANAKPVQQRLRRFHKEKRKAIHEELARLLAVGFIKEVWWWLCPLVALGTS